MRAWPKRFCRAHRPFTHGKARGHRDPQVSDPFSKRGHSLQVDRFEGVRHEGFRKDGLIKEVRKMILGDSTREKVRDCSTLYIVGRLTFFASTAIMHFCSFFIQCCYDSPILVLNLRF